MGSGPAALTLDKERASVKSGGEDLVELERGFEHLAEAAVLLLHQRRQLRQRHRRAHHLPQHRLLSGRVLWD
eukprot:6101327-Prymnesium_polylepis.1